MATRSASPPARDVKLRLLLAAVAVVPVVLAARHFELTARIPGALDWIRQQGALGIVAFVAGYVACGLFLPGSLLTLGAGAVFGVAWGFPLVSLAATLGATASFLLGRFVARDWVAAKAKGNPKVQTSKLPG